jgi:TonB family protein
MVILVPLALISLAAAVPAAGTVENTVYGPTFSSRSAAQECYDNTITAGGKELDCFLGNLAAFEHSFQQVDSGTVRRTEPTTRNVLEVTITEGPKKGVVFYVIDDAALRPSPSPAPAEADALAGSFVAPAEIPDETKDELDGDLDAEGGFAASSSFQAVRVGGQIKEPKKLRHVDAIYPRLARASRVQGTVALECVISPLGRVMDVRVIDSIPLLDSAAVEAVKQWVYAPTLLNGVPVPVIMTVTVRFRIS